MAEYALTVTVRPRVALSVGVQPKPAITSVVNVGKRGQPGAGTSLTPAERAVAGERVWIDGYTVGGEWDAATQAAIDAKRALGWPDSAIVINYLGESGASTGSFTLPVVSLTPSLAACSLDGISVGAFEALLVSLQPQVAVPSISGIEGGGFSLPTVSCQPVISAVDLDGVQTGTFALPSASCQPAIVVSTLTGVSAGVGTFDLPALFMQPVIAVSSFNGIASGSFDVPQLTEEATVVEVNFSGVESGSFAISAVTVQPSVVANSLVGMQIGSFAVSQVTCEPQVVATNLIGVLAGSFVVPQVTCETQVTGLDLIGISVGNFAVSSLTCQPLLVVPSLTYTVPQVVDDGSSGWTLSGGTGGNPLPISASNEDPFGTANINIQKTLNVIPGTIYYNFTATPNVGSAYIQVGSSYSPQLIADGTIHSWTHDVTGNVLVIFALQAGGDDDSQGPYVEITSISVPIAS